MANELTLISGATCSASNSIQILYTASVDTLITAFTATNSTGVNRSYAVYIYDASGGGSGPIVPTKFITSLRGFDLAPSIVGHIVPKGGTIRVECSLANSIVFWATGRQV